MTLLVVYVLLALTVSFLCSLLEASLLTITPVAINNALEKKLPWAPRMDLLKKEIDRPLSAILTLNTAAHTMGAAGAGAQYARVFGEKGEAIFAGILTLAILLVTEIIPKTLGTRFAIPLAGFTSRILPPMITLLAPLIWVSQKITRSIAPARADDLPEHREELLAMARIGVESGQLHERENQFVQNLIQLHSTHTRDIMTPRTVIFSLPESMRIEDSIEAIEEKPFSRIPVYREASEDISGFVIRSEILVAHLQNPDLDATLADFKRPIAVAPDHVSVDQLFERFIAERHQIMLVIDEFGTSVGLVTFEDVIETIFGIEILDEHDKVADLQLHARNLWRERARKMGINLDESDINENGDES
ncbi:MAG TPA: CNNM domain-containing protein [Opitutales bacterium]|nr:CNNM domain-containing protein [Opitutales bacterium]